MKPTGKRGSLARGLILTAAVFLLTAAALGLGAGQVDRRSEKEQAAALEDTVRRAAVLFYAVEGRYPTGVKELEGGYGVRYNADRFIVSIDGFASNLLPDIRVMAVGGGGNE